MREAASVGFLIEEIRQTEGLSRNSTFDRLMPPRHRAGSPPAAGRRRQIAVPA
jgi:hypothetical protein